MIGISLITQFVTYPSFSFIESNSFRNYHKKYSDLMLFIAGPIMTLELITVFFLIDNYGFNKVLYPFILLILIWILTFLFIVPTHNKIASNFNTNSLNILIRFNAIRTILWVIKIIFLTLLIFT
jgi:hypothetical protein